MNRYIIAAIITILLISSGQVILKYFTQNQGFCVDHCSIDTVGRLITNPYLLLGIALYIAAAILWMYALSGLDLNVAYFLVSISFPLVFVLSYTFLNEEISSFRIAGICLILLANVIVLVGDAA